jgi:hypothetical protein
LDARTPAHTLIAHLEEPFAGSTLPGQGADLISEDEKSFGFVHFLESNLSSVDKTFTYRSFTSNTIDTIASGMSSGATRNL